MTISFNPEQALWVEKYRPSTIADCILPERIKKEFVGFVESGDFPSMILAGSAGIGKTTVARALCQEMGMDHILINASNERGIDVLRTQISQFASTVSFSDNPVKVIIMDEFDQATPLLQTAMRAAIEEFTNARFILTCVPAGTRVYTPHGYIPIEEMEGGETIFTATGVRENKTVVKSVAKRLITIKTVCGNTITATPEHRFLVDGEWKRADSFAIGDNIPVSTLAVYGKDYQRKNDFKIPSHSEFIEFLDRKIKSGELSERFRPDYILMTRAIWGNLDPVAIPRLIGFMNGDGGISDHKSVHAASRNSECLEAVAADLIAVFGADSFRSENLNIRPTHSKGLKIQFTSGLVALVLEFFGATVGNKTERGIKTPRFCFESQDFFHGYFQALYDCEGNRITISKNNKTVAPAVLRMNTVIDTGHAEDMIDLLRRYFSIEGNIRKFKTKYQRATFRLREGAEPRTTVAIQICEQKNIMRFLGVFGNHYEQYKRADDLMAYIKYKLNFDGCRFMEFQDWRERYYADGIVNDEIASIVVEDGEFNVYDCSLDEEHSYITNGFISHNCNYPNKIIDPIHSRCPSISLAVTKEEKMEMVKEFGKRVFNILKQEGVEHDKAAVGKLILRLFPDYRKILNTLQRMSKTGAKLDDEVCGLIDKDQDISKLVKLLAAKDFPAMRQWVAQNAQDDVNLLYRKVYDNLKDMLKPEYIPDAIIKIADYQYRGVSSPDPEINFVAFCIEMMGLEYK